MANSLLSLYHYKSVPADFQANTDAKYNGACSRSNNQVRRGQNIGRLWQIWPTTDDHICDIEYGLSTGGQPPSRYVVHI